MHEDVRKTVHHVKFIICSILFQVETDPCLLVTAGHGTAVLFLLITFTPGTVIAGHRVIKSVREVVTESSAEPSQEPGRFIIRKVMFSPVSVCSQRGPHVTMMQ